MRLLSDSPEKTVAVGRELGKLLKPGSVICLAGGLGAGKTHFAKGIALGLGVEGHVTSPTFTIINEYEGRLPLYHIDAYRLESGEEAYELGLEEYFAGGGVAVIEWPEHIKHVLPDEHLTVKIDVPDRAGGIRQLEFTASGAEYDKLIEELGTGVHTGD